jgi:hypothetical protein
MTDSGGVHITNEQIFTELRQMSDRLTVVVGKLESLGERSSDHETRLRDLEKVDADHRLSMIEASKKDNRALWVAISIAVSAWVPDLIQLLGK